MTAPIFRRFTRVLPLALDAFLFSTDDITTLTFYRANNNNQIQDVVSDPAPGAGVAYEVDIWKNSLPTGRNLFSRSLDPASAGRVAIGPIDVIGPADLSFQVAQRLGALAAYNFLVKLDHP